MLSLSQWEPSEHTVGDHAITFEVKRLSFVEAKAFQVHSNRLRFDVLVSQGAIIEAMQREDARARRECLKRALADAGLSWPTLDDAKAGWQARHAQAVADDVDGVTSVTVDAVPADELLLLEATARLKAAGHDVPELSADDTARLVAEQEPHIRAIGDKMAEFAASLDDEWIVSTFERYVRHVRGVEVDGEPVTTGAQLLAVADENLVLYVLRRIKALCELSAHAKKTSSLPRTSAPEARTFGGSEIARPAERADSLPPATATQTPTVPVSSSASEEAPASVLVSP